MGRVSTLVMVSVSIIFFASAYEAHAGTLTSISDLIESSQPATSTNHTISFRVSNAIPASGKIVVRTESAGITFPAGLDVSDVDVRVDSGSGLVHRSLASSPSSGNDGISFTTGTPGSLTITLNSTTGISASTVVEIAIGTHATSSAMGDTRLINPAALGAQRIIVETKTSGDVLIDEGKAMIFILEPVGVSAASEVTAPQRFNGLPSGEIAAGNSTIEISLQTLEPATCRYSTTAGVLYTSMTNQFPQTNATLFSLVLGGYQDGQAYTYYVRCTDGGGDNNDDDYAIAFNLKITATSTTSVNSGTGSGGLGGIGNVSMGSSVLFLASIMLNGYSIPGGNLTIVKDGKNYGIGTVNDKGLFSTTVSNLERGTYTLLAYVTDSLGRKSSGITAVATVGSGSNNVLTNLVIPPTIGFSKERVALREDVILSGSAYPGSTIEIVLSRQLGPGRVGESRKINVKMASSSEGQIGSAWQTSISGLTLNQGTYQAKARMLLPNGLESEYGSVAFVGVGEAASPDLAGKADANGDGKVNLVDFSIMLTSWNTSNPTVDLNGDGIVTLADFSILLFNWTG